jgi:hypothetical protein
LRLRGTRFSTIDGSTTIGEGGSLLAGMSADSVDHERKNVSAGAAGFLELISKRPNTGFARLDGK